MLSRRIVAAAALVAACLICSGASASLTQEMASKGCLVFWFGKPVMETPMDIELSDGSAYSKAIGFGWDQDLTRQTRDRGDGCRGIAILESGVSLATFIVDLPDGDYLFEATSWDTQFAGALAPRIDGEFVGDPIRYSARQSVTMPVPVTSRNGQAKISFVGGRDGVGNCLLYSIRISPASADAAKWRAATDASDAYRMRAGRLESEKLTKRERQRAAYRPITIADQRQPRQTIDLSGTWLFDPTSEISKMDPADPRDGDLDWHTMSVPEFWKPIEWWIYMAGAGTSHNFYRKELERCQDLTFDYKSTNAGWYRQWIEVPASMRGKRLVLHFDAVAAVAQVYWNGKLVGSHIGMFGPFECDVTPEVKFGGKNLLAVMVSSGKGDAALPKTPESVAVTVNITSEMLNSLAHGWYIGGMAGIWQPVRLVVSGKSRIEDVFFRPRLDGASIETKVSSKTQGKLVRHSIIDAATGAVLYNDTKGAPVWKGQVGQDTGTLRPKLWSPEHPNLYVLKTRLISGGKVVDEVSTTVGFKTFEARGNRLYLNGKPYFLRGADMPPHELKPHDKALAEKFMKMMHDGNTMATRFHVGPPSQIWLDAADKYGVGASVGENWPWILMGDTPIPDKRLIALWQKDFLEVVHANRNHPCMFMWTISNESYFEGDKDLARRVEKYRIFSDLIKAVRREAPGTPVVFHSGHVRSAGEMPMLTANHFDDGDIDDAHYYFGWYNRSPFQIDVAKDLESRGTGKRPLISQEASTGYPDNDTGHPVETYIRNHMVPQTWVGDHALYSSRPDMFLETHAQITKEYAEKVRRERKSLSGWMIFANCCWFRDVYDAETIMPYPVYWAVQKAWQPVLVSLDSSNRHFVAGQKFTSEVFVVNDDPDRAKLTNLSLVWHVRAQSNEETSGRAELPDCLYDGKSHARVEFEVPARLPVDSINGTLVLELRSGDAVISRNDYPLICAPPDWYASSVKKPVVVLETDSITSDYFISAGIPCVSRVSVDWKTLAPGDCVVTGHGIDKSNLGSLSDFAAFIQRGGRALMIGSRGKNSVIGAIPDFDADKVVAVDTSGDFVDVLVGDLLSGLDPMNMHWWNAAPDDVVRVCRMSYQLPDGDGITMLARHIQPHGYIHSPEEKQRQISYPAFEVKRGGGKVIVSSFLKADDPIARRFASNLIAYLAR
jgi:beta-galactosidase